MPSQNHIHFPEVHHQTAIVLQFANPVVARNGISPPVHQPAHLSHYLIKQYADFNSLFPCLNHCSHQPSRFPLLPLLPQSIRQHYPPCRPTHLPSPRTVPSQNTIPLAQLLPGLKLPSYLVVVNPVDPRGESAHRPATTPPGPKPSGVKTTPIAEAGATAMMAGPATAATRTGFEVTKLVASEK